MKCCPLFIIAVSVFLLITITMIRLCQQVLLAR